MTRRLPKMVLLLKLCNVVNTNMNYLATLISCAIKPIDLIAEN